MAKFDKKFESTKQEWPTPDTLYEKLDNEFNFTWDLAATVENTKCTNFYTKEDNALEQIWEGVCWLNPPYGDSSYKLLDWIKKAYTSTQKDSNLTVVMLIPARTNTKWFHTYCMKAAELKFICGRPKFGGAKYGLPQPLVVVVFKQAENTKFSSLHIS